MIDQSPGLVQTQFYQRYGSALMVQHECNAGLSDPGRTFAHVSLQPVSSRIEFLETVLSKSQSTQEKLLQGQAVSDWRILCFLMKKID